MKKFVYWDNKKGELMLEVEAENILTADKILKEKTGF